jgi:hypothetical protein
MFGLFVALIFASIATWRLLRGDDVPQAAGEFVFAGGLVVLVAISWTWDAIRVRRRLRAIRGLRDGERVP